MKVSDVDDFMVWDGDERVAKFCDGEPCTSREEAIDFIKSWVVPHPWHRAICLDGKPIGTITMSRGSRSNGSACLAEVGYLLAWQHWGKGIATTAVKMAGREGRI
ncbi:unnamed protein product [Linum tenue]|uniref:N-acetyltransferase domain-containing protein n=1 Tax=Linum tenue TaxID=586396 RepID=A0AAV0P6D8_9ROSI|nr:unnamed protein product [Linum tenue]